MSSNGTYTAWDRMVGSCIQIYTLLPLKCIKTKISTLITEFCWTFFHFIWLLASCLIRLMLFIESTSCVVYNLRRLRFKKFTTKKILKSRNFSYLWLKSNKSTIAHTIVILQSSGQICLKSLWKFPLGYALLVKENQVLGTYCAVFTIFTGKKVNHKIVTKKKITDFFMRV